MKTVWRILSARMHVPFFAPLEEIAASFSAAGRIVFFILSFLLLTSSLSLLYMVSNSYLVEVPSHGGSLVEGVVGTPRFVNPLLALSDADRDLVALVYSGLLKQTADGSFVPDLAESYEISEDGLIYTFTLKDDVVFQDGSLVTSEDVLYTIARAQDPGIKGPKRANWDGVVVETDGERTVRFILKSPYAPFIANTTLGILPKNLWKDVSAEEFPFSNLNTEPIGSGPYRVVRVTRNASGIPSHYELSAFEKYADGKPYLSNITLAFSENEEKLADAFLQGTVEAISGVSPSRLALLQDVTVQRAPLNRVFGVFFNQNQSEVLRNEDVRFALNEAIDRERLVERIVNGYGTPLFGPLPPNLLDESYFSSASSSKNTYTLDTSSSTDRALNAREYLLEKGWTVSEETGFLVRKLKVGVEELQFALATGNIPELRAAAEFVKEEWGRMGAKVEVKIYEAGDLSQNVIRPRRYDALLFGEVVSRELDLFAFWHSSQRNDPGLNVSLYTNATADSALEKLRVTSNKEERVEAYTAFRREMEKDLPAVFLYSPDFTYVFPEHVRGLSLQAIGNPSERFLSVRDWHIESDFVWSPLTRFAE